ncbi:MAG: site-2 protease family protein [Phycisphaerae bacterium]
MDPSAETERPAPEPPANAPLGWVDSQGRQWTLHAGPGGIALECEGGGFEIPRARFATDLYISPMAGETVVRFCGPEDEVGFLVPTQQADELQRRIQARSETPESLARHEEAAAEARRPIWPKMSAVSVWALIAASLAFIPFVGLVFAAVATLLLVLQRGRQQDSAAWLHVRWMGRITIAWMLWGLAVCALGSWTWMQPPVEVSAPADLAGGDLGYTWTVRILSLVVIVISLSVHEAAHAVTAWWCGDDFARSQGRVTLNPLSHIDPFGTVILPLLLTMSGAPVFGYARPVPVRLGGVRRYRRAHILISIAGPGSNLLLAALALSVLLTCGCLLRFIAPGVEVWHFANLFNPSVQLSGFSGAPVVAVLLSGLKLAFLINVFLAAFNMIPVPPLDGSWVLEHLFPNTLGRVYAAIRPLGFIIFVGLLWSGMLMPLLAPAMAGVGMVDALFASCVVG